MENPGKQERRPPRKEALRRFDLCQQIEYQNPLRSQCFDRAVSLSRDLSWCLWLRRLSWLSFSGRLEQCSKEVGAGRAPWAKGLAYAEQLRGRTVK